MYIYVISTVSCSNACDLHMFVHLTAASSMPDPAQFGIPRLAEQLTSLISDPQQETSLKRNAVALEL